MRGIRGIRGNAVNLRSIALSVSFAEGKRGEPWNPLLLPLGRGAVATAERERKNAKLKALSPRKGGQCFLFICLSSAWHKKCYLLRGWRYKLCNRRDVGTLYRCKDNLCSYFSPHTFFGKFIPYFSIPFLENKINLKIRLC